MNMNYSRICDVPKAPEILVPHRVTARHKTTGHAKIFQFEMRYGAYPQHWSGWLDSGYCYVGVLPSPDGFRTVNSTGES